MHLWTENICINTEACSNEFGFKFGNNMVYTEVLSILRYNLSKHVSWFVRVSEFFQQRAF